MYKERVLTLLSRKLTDEATLSELNELEQLLVDNESMQLTAQIIEQYWFKETENDADYLEATYQLHLMKLARLGIEINDNQQDEKSYLNTIRAAVPSKKSLKVILYSAILITVAASITATLFLQPANLNPTINKAAGKINQSEITTKNGSRTKIQLPDGTAVWLNGNSKLMYDPKHYGELIREVSLTGEGYFDVVKNSDKPFIIHTNKMDIKVLGTVFNVRCYPEEKKVETSLIRGSIEVTIKNRKDKIMLKPSEKLIINEDDLIKPLKTSTVLKTPTAGVNNDIITLRHLTIVPQDNTIAETAWVENRLVFSSESFEEVALKMEKWYGVTINFTDDKLKQEPFTATFKNESLAEVLHALQLTTKFTYKINKDKITISLK